jgi:hypothetical protein
MFKKLESIIVILSEDRTNGVDQIMIEVGGDVCSAAIGAFRIFRANGIKWLIDVCDPTTYVPIRVIDAGIITEYSSISALAAYTIF